MAAAAGIPPQLAALVNKQQKYADVYNRASAERRNAMRLDGLRAPHYPGTPFSLPRSAPDADVELLQHLPRLPRVLDANLFHAEHEEKLIRWVLGTFRGEALDALDAIFTTEERTPSTGDRVGPDSIVYRALRALIQHYLRPHAATELYQRLAAFEWGDSVADTRMRSDALWTQAVITADNTSGNTALDRFATPTWDYWVRDFLRPKFPAWVADLAKVHAVQFASADAMWSFLHKHEPAPAPSSLLALRDGPCFRCDQLGHVLKDCRAAMSDEEDRHLPRYRWPKMPPHPSQDRRRPADAPVPYERPGHHGAPTGGDRFITSIQALPADDGAMAANGAMAMFARQLEALQDNQAAQTQVLQHLSTLLVARMPSSVAVPTMPSPSREPVVPSTLHQLSTLPPARFGTTWPGHDYVPVPDGTPTWLRTDVAEMSITEEAQALNAAAASTSPTAGRRGGSARA